MQFQISLAQELTLKDAEQKIAQCNDIEELRSLALSAFQLAEVRQAVIRSMVARSLDGRIREID